MDISVKGRNLDVGDALKGHVEDHLSSAVTKYFMRAIDASVVFSREGRSLRAECAPGAGTAVTLHVPMIRVIGTADPGAAVAATQ